MISLNSFNRTDLHYLVVRKHTNARLWDIELGTWINEKKIDYDFDFTEKVTMGVDDMKRFTKEIYDKVNHPPLTESELNLSFVENLPDFKIAFLPIKESNAFYNEDRKNKFQISAGININFLKKKFHREEDKYLYENGGKHHLVVQFHSRKQLLEFADKLEEEAKKYDKKPKGIMGRVKKWLS